MSLRIFSRAFCAAAGLTLGLGTLASAQSATPSASPTPLPEIGHVQTSDRSTETLENAARTTYVVTKHDILTKGYRSVADALESIPGVTISAYGSTGSLASVNIRGSSSAQVLVLIDGMPAPNQQTGTLDLNAISTAGVEQIEIVEGGGSTLYGTGSIGGIINIITAPVQGGTIVDVRTGSFGDRLARIQTKNFTFERAVSSNNYAYPGGTRTDADSQTTAARFAYDKTFGALTASLSAGLNDHHVGVPVTVPATFSTPGRQNSVDRDARFELTWNRGHAATTLELAATSGQLLFWCIDPADPNCFSPLPSLTSETRVQASLRNVVTHATSKTVYGVDFARGTARIDDGGFNNLFNPPPDTPIVLTNAFAQSAAYVQQSWITNGGSRFYLGLRGERDGAQGGIFAPTAGFLQHLSRDVTLRGNYATAFRAPNTSELYYPGFGNTKLQAERERVADLKISDAAILGGASISWFGSWASNKIAAVFDPVTFVSTAENIGVSSTAGFTAELRTKPFHHLYDRLSVTDLYRALDLTNAPAHRIPGAGPVFVVNNELGFAGDPGSFVDSAGVVARNHGPVVTFGSVAAYTVVDGFVRFRISKDALLTVRAYNLGNEIYQEQPGYPMPGRSFVLELSTR